MRGGAIGGLEPRKKPRQARSQAMVDAILEAAARVLSVDGYSGATTNRIAEVAGVSVGSLYQYFPNKDALIMALSMQHMDGVFRLLHGAMLQEADIRTVIRSFVRAMVEAHGMDASLHRALTQQLLAVGGGEIAHRQRLAQQFVVGWLGSRRVELRSEIRGDRLEMVAFMLVSTVESAVHVALLEDSARLLSPVFEDELVALVERYLCCDL